MKDAKKWRERFLYLSRTGRKRLKESRDPLLAKMRTSLRAHRARIKLARKRGDGTVTADALAQLYKRQGGRCALTGRRLTVQNCGIDHKVPLKEGGEHTLKNIQLVTGTANHMKGGMAQGDFIRECRRVVRWTQGRGRTKK